MGNVSIVMVVTTNTYTHYAEDTINFVTKPVKLALSYSILLNVAVEKGVAYHTQDYQINLSVLCYTSCVL